MNTTEHILLPLQKLQYAHDEIAHRDILSFDLYKKLKHMVLHFYKYTGKIEAARENKDEEEFRRILLDAYIICMASANALNVSLGIYIKTEIKADTLDSLAITLSQKIDAPDLFLQAVRQFVLIGGKMAKAVESSDHMERGDPRSQMEVLVPQLTEVVLGFLGKVRGGLEIDIRNRLASVEQKSIFHMVKSGNGL